MAEIIRNRTIRPSSRLKTSKTYKINTEAVSDGDTLIVNISHESENFQKTYKFAGKDVAHKRSISFRLNENATSTEILWSGAIPIGSKPKKIVKALTKRDASVPKTKRVPKKDAIHSKTSFDPVSNSDTIILILGTMPGEKSLSLQEYYAHSRNRFWKVISAITKRKLPQSYEEKKNFLLKEKIGIWDVAYKVNRKGSLDSEISNVVPNDLESFIAKHPKLRVVAFNGKKSESLYDEYFERKEGIIYIPLPSSSPANTTINFDSLCMKWSKIIDRSNEDI